MTNSRLLVLSSSSPFVMFNSIFILICLQTSIIRIEAQVKQHESVLASNVHQRSTSTLEGQMDNPAYEGNDFDIYDDGGNPNDISSTSKSLMNKTLSNAIQPDDIPQTDYDDEDDHGQHDEVIDDENSQSDGTNPFGDTLPNHRPDLHSTPSDTNGKPSFDSPSSTSRLPFVPSNLWRELFAKPGILVGIIGGVVIGMLSAILLVMFIIYRMRKKDEGSYALEEGPRKSPSHAYTRVSSREFFA